MKTAYIEIGDKTCIRCGASKPVAEFIKGRTYCKQCEYSRQKKRREEVSRRNHANPPPSDGQKTCSRCHETKAKIEFSRCFSRNDGFSVVCKVCDAKDNDYRNHYKRTNEKYKRSQKAYKKTESYAISEVNYRQSDKRKSCLYRYNNSDKRRMVSVRYVHRRRILIENNGGDFTKDEWDSLCDKFGNKCLACGAEGTLTIDHIVPVTQGGRNDITNLQPLCRSCNAKKGTKIIDYRQESCVDCIF